MTEDSTYFEVLMSLLMQVAAQDEPLTKDQVMTILATHQASELWNLVEVIEATDDSLEEQHIAGLTDGLESEVEPIT